MEGHIAIIDQDPVFARSMSERLMYLIPRTRISLYSPDDLLRDPSLELTENVILFDKALTDQEALCKHTLTSSNPCFIPLEAQGTEGRSRMTGTELSRRIREASDSLFANQHVCCINEHDSPPYSQKPPDEQSFSRPRGHMRILISFADRLEREKYAANCGKSLLSSGLRVIRLNLMSGISMMNPFLKTKENENGTKYISSGISELLLQLESVRMEPDEILHYVQLGQDGCYHFGFPVRSDDILCCNPDILVRLLHLLRRIADSADDNSAVIVVTESLPFHVLKKICSLSHELHIIMPPQGYSNDKLFEWELNDLFSSLPPNQLKFFTKAKTVSV